MAALQRLPGFCAKTPRELMRMLVDHSIAVVTLQPRQAAFSAGDTVDQARIPPPPPPPPSPPPSVPPLTALACI